MTLPAAATGIYTTGKVIGSDLYVVNGGGNADCFKMYRYDLSVNPPSLTNTITLSVPSWFNSAQYYPRCVAHDGTNFYINYGVNFSNLPAGWWRHNSSGDRLGQEGTFASFVTETASAPYAGTKANGGLYLWADIEYEYPEVSGSAQGAYGNADGSWGNYQEGFAAGAPGSGYNADFAFWANLGLQGLTANDLSDRIVVGMAELGFGLGSRVLLGSDTTKTSSNTMKVTYDVTLPDFI